MDKINALLLSNSTMAGQSFLAWSKPIIVDFLTNKHSNIVFIPFAGVSIDWDDYTDKFAATMGVEYNIKGLHQYQNIKEALATAEAVIVGGGNTFSLYNKMHDYGLMPILRQRIDLGLPYVGWSAGANLACPSLKTTNDMPIVDPISFEGLGIVPFQINAHYTEKTIEGHGGESRLQRLEEFGKINPNTYVIGLKEGTFILVNGHNFSTGGTESVVVIKDGKKLAEIAVPSKLNLAFNVT